MKTMNSGASNLCNVRGKQIRLLPDGGIIERYTGKQVGMIMNRDLLDEALTLRGTALAKFIKPFLH